MSLILAVILLTTSASISLSAGDFLRIAGIILSSVAYLSVFYLVGMLISAATRRTGTALMLAMFVWGFWVLVYPNVILATIASPDASQARGESAKNQIQQIWEELDRERKQFLANDAAPGEDPHFGIRIESGVNYYEYPIIDSSVLKRTLVSGANILKLHAESESMVPHAQNYYRFLGPQMIDAAERTWLVRKPALETIFVQPAISWIAFYCGSHLSAYTTLQRKRGQAQTCQDSKISLRRHGSSDGL